MRHLEYYRPLAGSRLQAIVTAWGSTPAPVSDAVVSQLYRSLNNLPELPRGADPYRGFSAQAMPLAQSRQMIGQGIQSSLEKLKAAPNPPLDVAVDAVLRFVSGLPDRPEGTDPYVRLFPAPGIQEDNTQWDPTRSGQGAAVRLTIRDYREVSAQYGIPVPVLQAFAEIESNGGGFLPDGRQKILFEGQWFWHHLRVAGLRPDQLTHRYPTIVYPRWTRAHYLGGVREHERLRIAEGIHRHSARMSASWGMFQLMGFNHAVGGYSSVDAMVSDYQKGERQHLNSILKFMESKGINAALKAGRYRQAITLYNGSGQVDYYLGLFNRALHKYGG